MCKVREFILYKAGALSKTKTGLVEVEYEWSTGGARDGVSLRDRAVAIRCQLLPVNCPARSRRTLLPASWAAIAAPAVDLNPIQAGTG